MKISEKLIEAKSYLTEETWLQGRLFLIEFDSGNIRLCAHASCAVASNEAIKAHYDKACAIVAAKQYAYADISKATELGELTLLIVASDKGNQLAKDGVMVAWKNRPSWLNENNQVSYVAGMAGLTIDYNDTHSLPEVLAKFDEAIAVAQSLGI